MAEIGARAGGGRLTYAQMKDIVSSGHGVLTPSYLMIRETAALPGASAWNHVLHRRQHLYGS